MRGTNIGSNCEERDETKRQRDLTIKVDEEPHLCCEKRDTETLELCGI